MSVCIPRKQTVLWRLGDELRSEKHNNNLMHHFKYPVYSIKRKNGCFYLDFENANTSTSGDNVRSILAQVDSMKLEDREELSSEVGWAST